jgi:DNA-directed RNA polymerase omega subunit
MARVTVDDCLARVESPFELVLQASRRARRLEMFGEEPMVPADGNKATVVALQEIAAGYHFRQDGANLNSGEQETQENTAGTLA